MRRDVNDVNEPTSFRWLRFNLRSLFLLVLIVAAYFGGWRSALWTAEREKQAAVRKAVEQLQTAPEHMHKHVHGGLVGQPDMYVIREMPNVVITGAAPRGRVNGSSTDALQAAIAALSGDAQPSLPPPADAVDAPPVRAPQERP
jgi:hypothetical protein